MKFVKAIKSVITIKTLKLAKQSVALGATVLLLVNCALNSADNGLVGGDKKGQKPTRSNPNEKIVRNNLIKFDYKKGDADKNIKGEIETLCEQSLQKFNARLASASMNAYELDEAFSDFNDEVMPLTFMAYVSQEKALRDEASACEEQVNQKLVEFFTRPELYKKIKATRVTNSGEKRLLAELKRSFEQNGMSFSKAKLVEFKKLRAELAALEAKFTNNLNEDNSSVAYTLDELQGVPKSFLSELKKDADGKLIVTTKSTHYTQVMENAKNPETRRRMLEAYENRQAEANTPLLEKAIVLRAQIAKMMNYPTWADYRIDGRMAKNSTKALELLNDLKNRLGKRLEQDLQVLLEAKRSMDDPDAKQIEAWDIHYYSNQVRKRDFNLDNEVLKEYFPKDTVMAGLFEIYETLLHVRFEEVPNAKVWAPEVKLYAIHEKLNDAIIGYFYTDFVPRKGKYSHAAAFPLILGRITTGLYYSQPVSAIVANFTPPTKDKPSLLTHREVETLFHEFGHIMHQTLTRAPYGYLSGTATAQDFVEAPSQMLENWVWDATMLNKISGHYKNPSEKLPKNLVEKLISSRSFNQGYHYSRQLVLGLSDLEFHTSNKPVDVTETYKKVYRDILRVQPLSNTHFCASFGHLMGGYDAGYYGYIWSEVYAEDMFTSFENAGLLNAGTGLSYRKNILESGSMRDPELLVKDFLGRKPTMDAFFKRLGL